MKESYSLPVSIASIVLMFCLGSLALALDVPCATPARLARTNGASWAQGTITVIINPTDFPTEEHEQPFSLLLLPGKTPIRIRALRSHSLLVLNLRQVRN